MLHVFQKVLKHFFFIFFLFFLIKIKRIEMLHVLQKVESIHETQPGFSLVDQNIHKRYYINILIFLHKGFYKKIVNTHFYVVICIRTLKNARCKIKIQDPLKAQKRSVLAEVLLSIWK